MAPFVGVLLGALTLAPAPAVCAQAPATNPPTRADTQQQQRAPSADDLARMIALLQQRVDQQDQQIAELKRQLALATATVGQLVPTSPPPAAPQTVQTQEERRTSRVPELPPDIVSAGEFPGSIKIPGTDAALKVGGLVRVNWVSTNNALTVEDRFVTSAIAVAGTAEADRGARVDV